MIINLTSQIPKTPAGFAVANQLARSGTSVGANTEEAQGSLTKKEFIKTMTVALKEARETKFWLEIVTESNLLKKPQTERALKEVEELIKILVTIIKNAKSKS